MLDVKFVVENAELVKKAMATRSGQYDVDIVVELDKKRREILKEVELLKAERNRESAEVAALKKAKQDASAIIERMKTVGDRIKALDEELAPVEADLRMALLSIPNIPDATVPVGADDRDNVEIRKYSVPTQFDFEPKQYREVKRSYMTMGFTVNTAQLFGDIDLISGLLEEELGLIATVELTPELDAKYLTAPVLRYADLSAKRTSEMIDVLVKAGMDSLTSEKIQELIGTPVRDAIITMRDTLGGIELDSAVIVPDVFTLLTEQMFPRDEQKKIGGTVIEFGDGEIKGLLEALYDIPEITTTTDGKTYLTKDGVYVDVFGTGLDNATGKVDKLNSYISLSSSLPTGITLPELDSDLGKVVGYYYGSTNNKMFLAYEYSLAQYLGGDSSASGLLTVEKIYATFEIDFNTEGVSTTVSSSKMTVNKMTDEKKNTLDKMLTYLDEDNEGKLSDLESNVGSFALGVKNLDDAEKLNDSSGD